jgi:hypothetical protein
LVLDGEMTMSAAICKHKAKKKVKITYVQGKTSNPGGCATKKRGVKGISARKNATWGWYMNALEVF